MPKKGYKQTKRHRDSQSKVKKQTYKDRPELKEKIRKGVIKAYEEGILLPTIGIRNGMFGRKMSDKRKRENSEWMKKAIEEGKYENKYLFPEGEDNPSWNHGSSFEPYDSGFNKSKKLFIKQRDDFTCQVCDEECDVIHIHHIDYNKENSSLENLLSLCNSCHGKTNANRKYWEWQLKILQKIRGISNEVIVW